MREVVDSPSAAERLSAARAFLERLPPSIEVLIVGSTRDAADDLARQITAARGATFGLHRTSLIALAAQLAAPEMARHGVAPATTLGTVAIAARASFEAERDRALAYFAPVARFPGFASAVPGGGAARTGRFRGPITREGGIAEKGGPLSRLCSMPP